MEISCPACKKITAADLCERCGADISVLKKILRAARSESLLARKKLQSGEVREALRHAEKSWRLKKNDLAAKIAFSACLVLDDFQSARFWYVRSCLSESR